VSAEPLLGPLRLGLDGELIPGMYQWLVVGCESGKNRRPCKLEWVESIVDQCRAANIPVFVKQLDIGGKCVTDINKFPEHLRIRQVPWTKDEVTE
jgi:protein gp37